MGKTKTAKDRSRGGQNPPPSVGPTKYSSWRCYAALVSLIVVSVLSSFIWFKFLGEHLAPPLSVFELDHPPLYLSQFKRNGGIHRFMMKLDWLDIGDGNFIRGVSLEKKVSKGQMLMRIPKTDAIGPQTVNPALHICQYDNKPCSMVSILMLGLVYELQLGGKSRFYSYIKSLPSLHTFTNTIAMTAAQSALIRKEMSYEPEILMELQELFTHIFPTPITEDQAKWAAAVVFSRRFDSPEPVLVPGADLLNHHWNSSECGLLSGLESFQNIPVYQIPAIRNMKEGEHLCEYYGAQPNDDLLDIYGFIMPDNPFQAFVHIDTAKSFNKVRPSTGPIEWPTADNRTECSYDAAFTALRSTEGKILDKFIWGKVGVSWFKCVSAFFSPNVSDPNETYVVGATFVSKSCKKELSEWEEAALENEDDVKETLHSKTATAAQKAVSEMALKVSGDVRAVLRECVEFFQPFANRTAVPTFEAPFPAFEGPYTGKCSGMNCHMRNNSAK